LKKKKLNSKKKKQKHGKKRPLKLINGQREDAPKKNVIAMTSKPERSSALTVSDE
jgi:hypothetical protein